ncbi:uncharacterized protein [Dermacentor albipictus]|uniref:uncharacterized protein isoform X2 n=1 Tax=Dermacentor albipictus TaxID=60249 RepID=UPI0038FD2847
MTEERNGGRIPHALTFRDEATHITNHKDAKGASAICDDYTTLWDDSFDDLWNALNSQTGATDDNDVAHGGSTCYPNVVSSSSANHASPSTSRPGMEKALSIPEDIARIAESTWVHLWNTQCYPILGSPIVQGMLLEREEENSKCSAMSAAMFPADGMPYTGTPTNTRTTQPTFAKHVINRLLRGLSS